MIFRLIEFGSHIFDSFVDQHFLIGDQIIELDLRAGLLTADARCPCLRVADSTC